MSAFDLLHPALQHHIVNSLGWSRLRPLQEATIEPILRGEHAILLAPTAGGKTEAAAFPVFSRMLAEDWHGLSVLYICPIKALLNNLESRLSYYAGLLGRSVGIWHGDIGAAAKNKIKTDPPDILLTTPESLEVMLVSSQVDHQRMFGNLRCVVIDEVHAFAGDDRGWHFLYVLERITKIAGREIQRLGLSATVGNPDDLCDWLARDCQKPRQVINPPADKGADPKIEIDWVGNLQNAALVISRLHRGEKRLVFCDSRARVEELTVLLRAYEVKTFVSHSCLSLEERTAAEQAFSEGENCVIVATSTLELGIDVGDLDRVIQIDAPGTVSSVLQRMGRTGRRSGSERNYLFLVTKESAFLHVAALMQLWSEGFVEPITPPPLPFHIFAQQVMALALQESGIGQADWHGWFSRIPGLEEIPRASLDQLIEYMVNQGILHSDQGVLSIGESGERQFGRRNFMELYSVFLSPPLVKIFHGKLEIGEVHQSTFLTPQSGPTVLTLAGRSWQITYIDWSRRKAFVEPSAIKGKSRWLSSGEPLHFELCQAIPRVLSREGLPVAFSRRAVEKMDELRTDYDWVEPEQTYLVRESGGQLAWWTFAGKLTNASLSARLSVAQQTLAFDELAIYLTDHSDAENWRGEIQKLLSQVEGLWLVPLDEKFIGELKFAECLSPEAIDEELSSRFDVSREVCILKKHPLSKLQIA